MSPVTNNPLFCAKETPATSPAPLSPGARRRYSRQDAIPLVYQVRNALPARDVADVQLSFTFSLYDELLLLSLLLAPSIQVELKGVFIPAAARRTCCCLRLPRLPLTYLPRYLPSVSRAPDPTTYTSQTASTMAESELTPKFAPFVGMVSYSLFRLFSSIPVEIVKS